MHIPHAKKKRQELLDMFISHGDANSEREIDPENHSGGSSLYRTRERRSVG
jgi:hypothetical protein